MAMRPIANFWSGTCGALGEIEVGQKELLEILSFRLEKVFEGLPNRGGKIK
jgi:hypothetical protein